MDRPAINDYYELLSQHGENLLTEGADGLEVKVLFEAAVRLLTQPSTFNRQLSMILRASARSYKKGEALAVEHFENAEHCQMFLLDLFANLKKKGAQA
ncbi:hypothetical protein Mmc1_1185 [Magnetococcus marinus MC-1]|uniref:Uncharacterized protein n=1 Tax=Magnetococcus marinus (strain ATCC BAA-1437 / JCM 17883 / MC-1) TaxID=156889 RepID=A0L6V3_MAGMM|nr:hypothetical protein [Magnetococcus marinus]ABK43696.1 hypothetical protein Mmc1_1185 [Magnetococcus marinus MC-1]